LFLGIGHPGIHRQRTEMQRIHRRHWPRAHCEYVAQDAANAGSRALIGLDERWVIVRLDFESGGQTSPKIDYSGILAGPLKHKIASGGQPPEVRP
jgi:hypothetical protein